MTEPPHDGDETPAARSPDEAPDRTTRVLRIFLTEPMLWPVGVVLFLSGISFGALILLYALQMRGLAAGAALLVLIFGTVRSLGPDLQARRLSPASALLLAFWLGSAGVGAILMALGAF